LGTRLKIPFPPNPDSKKDLKKQPVSIDVIDKQSTDPNTGLITHRELAGLLRISVQEVHRRRCDGQIPFVDLGRKTIRYSWPRILEVLKNLERTGPTQVSINPKARKRVEVSH
jgi:hypothetical protein